jgi:plastocyanin
MNRMAMLLSSVMLSAGVLTACGGGGQPSSSPITSIPPMTAPTSTTAAPTGQITISDYTFTVPAPVSAGQQVTVVNNDGPNHTVTSDTTGAFDVRISGGGGFATFTAPTTPGTYPFHCRYHADMHGTLTVQ